MIEPETIRRYGRELRAMVKAGTDDPDAFAAVWQLLQTTMDAMPDAAEDLIRQGYSWADIGRALGITRQAAHHRYARRE